MAACQRPNTQAGAVAIVGGGVAGLTCAYRLARAGRAVTLYEASGRFGGRMFTRKDFNEDGQFCELGGELVDSNHAKLRALAQELNVAIDPLAPANERGADLYHIGGHTYAQHDMAGVFAPLARRIAEDREASTDAQDEWTARGRELDQLSLAQYLHNVSNLAPRWAMSLLEIAYRGEYGIPTEQQSALNLIDFIGAEPGGDFEMFGESDEAFRIHGGSSSLTEALAAQLGGVDRALQHTLAGIASTTSGVRLTFETNAGRIEREHTKIVLALPFTKLRQVAGIDTLGLAPEKLSAIRDLGYGDNSKLMISTTARPWREAHAFSAAPSGVFFSDRFQCVWETSRGQTGTRGILTNFLTGMHDRDAALASMRQGLSEFAPAMADSLDTTRTAWMDWSRQPLTLGSYAGPKIGQFTTLLEQGAPPSSDGRIHFAGEHTSVDFMGFMNGAVESGERVTAEILA